MQCPFCNRENQIDSTFCAHCGRRVDGSLQASEAHSVLSTRIAERKKLLGFCAGIIAGVAISSMAFISFLGHHSPTVRVQPSVTTAAPKPARHLSGKAVSFVDDSNSTPEEEANTDKEVEGFSQYLLRIHAA